MVPGLKQADGRKKWAKGALVAALVAVLAGLIGGEFLASSADAEPDLGPIRPASGAVAASSAPAPKPKPIVRITADQALAHDPFRMPEAIRAQVEALTAPEAAPPQAESQSAREESAEKDNQERLRQALERLRQQGVKMIVETDRGRAAVLGDRIVREGDRIDGFVVVRISKDGIDLASENDQP